jgi:hypothetical protein
VFARAGTTLAELAGAAGLRWTVEECFQRAKEPRPLRGALLAWLAPAHELVHGGGCASGEVGRRSAPSCFGQTERNESGRTGRSLTTAGTLLPTVPEIRYLLARLLLRSPTRPAFIMAWSLWRRTHQADAENRHYRRRDKAQL